MNLTDFWSKHDVKILGAISTIGTACNGGDHYLTKALSEGAHAFVALILTLVAAATFGAGFKK